MSDNGYVYAYRRSWSNPIFRNLKEAAVWNFLYQNAFWEDGERYYNNTKFNLKRGQIVLSISFLSKGFDMTDKEIRILLDKLKGASMVAIRGANKGTIITICNYDKYQRLEKTEGQTKGKQKGNNNNEVNEVNEGIIIEDLPKANKKGNRLEEELNKLIGKQDIPKPWGDWAHKEKFVDVETINWEWEKFYNYWIAQSGQKGVKLNWYSTWQNWIMKVIENRKEKEARNAVFARRG